MIDLRKREYFYGIKKQAVITMTVIISIIFVLTYIEISIVMSKRTYISLSTQYTYMNEKILLSFRNMYEEIDQLTGNFITNEYVQKTLGNRPLSLKERELMQKTLSYQNKSYLDYYLIIDNKNNLYSSKQVSLNMEKFKRSEIYKSLGDDYSRTKILWARDTVFGSNKMKFFAVRYIHEMNSNHEPGVIILELNDGIMKEVKRNIQLKELVYMIVDLNYQLCYQQKPEELQLDQKNIHLIISKALESPEKSKSWRNLKHGIIASNYDKTTGFTVITYAPAEVSNREVRKIQLLFAFIFGIAYAALFLFIVVFTKKITDPIKLLSNTMKEFDDTKFKEVLELNTNTELDCIGDAYNSMVQRVKQLMEDIQKKESELRKSERNILLYQIRPHFLYNTLDTIYMLARIQKEETIMKMIQALSKYLRIQLSNGREEYEIEQELEHVSSYLDIQKIRNAQLFEYEIQCEKGLEKYRIIKMILQPIVENCVKYGFKDIYEGGKIWIRVFSETDYVVIQIMNNGSPIEESELLKLNQLEKASMEEIDQSIEGRQGGFGICNVVKRLRLRYNDHIRFFYKLKENGTECVLKIESRLFILSQSK